MTETDKACEELILGRLRAAFPAHCFIGEEETAAAGGVLPAITDAPTWMVDPLDGTTNFVHRFPFSCVCVGLAVGKQPVVGVVHCPILKETFHAARGKGAFLNGERIEVSRTSEAQKALVATEIGVARDPAVMDNIMRRVRAVCEVRPAPVGSPWLAYTDHTSATGNVHCHRKPDSLTLRALLAPFFTLLFQISTVEPEPAVQRKLRDEHGGRGVWQVWAHRGVHVCASPSIGLTQ